MSTPPPFPKEIKRINVINFITFAIQNNFIAPPPKKKKFSIIVMAVCKCVCRCVCVGVCVCVSYSVVLSLPPKKKYFPL